MASRLIVGVVADTHGLVRPEAIEALRGSDVILHAGDIGGNHVLKELGGVPVLVLHDRALLGLEPSEEGLGAVVFGHSHQPLAEKRKGVLWFNPGSAGPRRFRLPVSVGRLVIEDGRVRTRLLALDV